MTLSADFYPAEAGRLHLVQSQIEAFLAEKGIVYGIQTKTLQQAIYECNTGKKHLENITVAVGTPPKKEVPAYWRLEPGLFQEKHLTPDGRIDYKEWTPYIIVYANQLLARAVAPRPGELGYNVRGEAIPYGKKDVVKILPGRNTLIRGGEVYAKISGRLVQDRSYFHVDDALEVDEVGYATGHIRFPGHLLVKNGVLAGFKVWVGQDLKVNATLDATDVYVHGHLEVKGGVLGKGRGLVRVGGDFHADFAENAKIDVLGSGFIRKTILHSEVLVNGDFSMGDNGKVLASLLMVRGNCDVSEVGNATRGARIVAGIDFVLKRKADALQLTLIDLENKKFAIKSMHNPTEYDLNRLERIEAELADSLQQYNELNIKMVNHQAVLKVTGHVYPSSIIELGHVVLEVREALHRKQFSLSEDGHSIRIENIPADKR